MSLSGRMQSLYDPATIVNGRFVAVAAPAGVGQKQPVDSCYQVESNRRCSLRFRFRKRRKSS